MDDHLSSDDLIKALLDGNERFRNDHPEEHHPEFRVLSQGQHPQVVVLACSDSRVGPELLFDCGLGELFVVRVAGNVATPTQLASIEYAVEHLESSLLVVLGHSHCGAIDFTMDVLKDPNTEIPGSLAEITDAIIPNIEGHLHEGSDTCSRVHAQATTEQIADLSPLLQKGN